MAQPAIGHGYPKDPAKQYRLLLLFCCLPEYDGETIAEDPAHLGRRTLRNQAGTDLEAFSLLACFHSAEGTMQAAQGGKSPAVSPSWGPVNYSNN